MIARYAIRADRGNGLPRYVAREVGLNSEGGLTQYVEESKTFASAGNAQRWMKERPEWRMYRAQAGYSLSVVPVRMRRGSKVVAVCAATDGALLV